MSILESNGNNNDTNVDGKKGSSSKSMAVAKSDTGKGGLLKYLQATRTEKASTKKGKKQVIEIVVSAHDCCRD
jgi:hypothetical protein